MIYVTSKLHLTPVNRADAIAMSELVTPRRSTPDSVVSGILAAVATGLPLDVACRNFGVSRQSFYVWMRDEPELVDRYAKATAMQIHSRFSRD